jgi:FkbM family methyltransferase
VSFSFEMRVKILAQKFDFTTTLLCKLSLANSTLFRLTAKVGEGLVQRYLSYGPRIIARILRPQSGKFQFSTYGVWLSSKQNDTTYRLCVDGSYGPFYFDYVSSLRNCNFLDIGSNIGLYSLIAARNSRVNKIYSFEPNLEVTEFLKQNLNFNGATKASVVPCAISNKSEQIVLKTFANHTGKSSLRLNMEGDSPDGETIIQAVDHEYLDTLFSNNNEPVAVKIDVEGHEIVVVETLRKAKIWPKVFSVFFEADERYIDVKKLTATLEDDGFKQMKKIGNGLHYDLLFERAQS